ncbi:MAG: 2-oxoacid:acceptor oxidoreductase subunit alpha [Candidatus Thorarchaeota archaeon]
MSVGTAVLLKKEGSLDFAYPRFALRLGGAAGDGLQLAGLLFQRFLNRLGYYVFGFPGTQSTIRGGHVWQHVEFSSEALHSFDRPIDLLVALTTETLEIHLRDLKQNGLLVVDSDRVNTQDYAAEIKTRGIALFEIPLKSLARSIDRKTPVLANSVAAGAIIQLLGLERSEYEMTLEKHFSGRTRVIQLNLDALDAGSHFFNENYQVSLNLTVPSLPPMRRFVISGNHMVALGAVAAGLKFLAQYPITPASSILTYLAQNARRFGVVVRQAEDELAAIPMCIGASFAGARAMTASSGPGLSLMSEAFGYAAMTETPLVVINSMRAGPSTGIPTKMEQGDLASAIYMSHGEAPRAIFAPRTVKECFEITTRAFNLADRFQLPVIVLSDFSLSERTTNLEPFDLDDVERDRGKIWNQPTSEFPEFARYRFTEDGVSPRAFPPTEEAMYILVGAEHDESSHSLSGNRCGHPSSWELRTKMFGKRFKKLELLRQEMRPPDLYGSPDTDHTIICWGSITGAVREAVDLLNAENRESWNVLSFVDLFPLPYKKIKPFLANIHHAVLYEVNYTGQLENLIHQYLDWRPDERVHPLSGETPTPSGIFQEIRELIDSHH